MIFSFARERESGPDANTSIYMLFISSSFLQSIDFLSHPLNMFYKKYFFYETQAKVRL